MLDISREQFEAEKTDVLQNKRTGKFARCELYQTIESSEYRTVMVMIYIDRTTYHAWTK